MANKMTDSYLANNKQLTVRGFIYDVDTGKLDEVSYPGTMGSIG
jgi:carbonic anhydrase